VSCTLVDENLPASLLQWIRTGAIHVTSLGARLTDRALWEYGRSCDATIVTKDADFFDLLAIHGSPPKVVWIRTGNLRRKDLETRIRTTWSEIESLLKAADLVEIHPGRLEAIQFGTKSSGG
jgi:predicted nuclease of predicted toxin-antitoxin system